MTKETQSISCMEIISFAVFILGTLLLFSKTSDLMTNFAPEEIAGYVGVQAWYGFGVALMIEGMLVAMKLKMMFERAKNQLEWAWDIVLTLTPFGISAIAQSIDSFVIAETLSEQPEPVQFAVAWGVPAIPAVIVGMILVRGFIDSAPEGMFGVGKTNKLGNPIRAIKSKLGKPENPTKRKSHQKRLP